MAKKQTKEERESAQFFEREQKEYARRMKLAEETDTAEVESPAEPEDSDTGDQSNEQSSEENQEGE